MRGGVGIGVPGVRVLGSSVVRASLAKQLCAIRLVLDAVAGLLQGVEVGAEGGEVLAKLADAFQRLLLLLGDNLPTGERIVVFDGLGKRRQGNGDVANLGGRWSLLVGEGGELVADGLALAQGRVVRDVLGKLVGKSKRRNKRRGLTIFAI